MIALAAALTVAAPSFASLQPIKRDFGELTLPRLRAGTIKVPAGHATGRVRVIVQLKQPPLAAVFARDKSAAQHRLNVSSGSSRAYLADGVVFLFNEDFERESSCHWSVTMP